MEGISVMNYQQPTPVQQQVIPEILSGKDVIACAQTGTGKTAAFLLPVMHRILSMPPGDYIKALVIVPTRELAIQIAQQTEGFGYYTSIGSLAVYGGGTGVDYSVEQRALRTGADIVVCTPGRMISHLQMGQVKVEKLGFLILDEADRMLDMGFNDDIMHIISYLPPTRQSLLFSATMPSRIRDMARKILKQPVEVNIALSRPPEKILQKAYVLNDHHKVAMVDYLTGNPELKSIIVFCDTKSKVKETTRTLKKNGRAVEEIHSDLEQQQREEVMNRFKSRQTRILVATDIISRGIDVEDIDMIINFDVPHDAEDYVHRIGRTARAESDGQAFTLIGDKEHRKFSQIEKLLEKEIEKLALPIHIGESPKYDPMKRIPSEGRNHRFGNAGQGKKRGGSRPDNRKRDGNRGRRSGKQSI